LSAPTHLFACLALFVYVSPPPPALYTLSLYDAPPISNAFRADAASALLTAQADLLDSETSCLGRRLLRQRQLQDTVGELGRGTALVDFLPQLEAARDLAEVTLCAQHAFSVLYFFFLLAFRTDRHHLPVDIHVDVVLGDARQFRRDGIALGVFLDVHAHFRRLLRYVVVEVDRAHEEPTQKIGKRIAAGKVVHEWLLAVNQCVGSVENRRF